MSGYSRPDCVIHHASATNEPNYRLFSSVFLKTRPNLNLFQETSHHFQDDLGCKLRFCGRFGRGPKWISGLGGGQVDANVMVGIAVKGWNARGLIQLSKSGVA